MEQGGLRREVRHHCGYVLWVRVLGNVEGMEVVEYRDGGRLEVLVYFCPGCGRRLGLWREVPSSVRMRVGYEDA